jgi:curli biogenesis system outer membrane secretion channel CsgG
VYTKKRLTELILLFLAYFFLTGSSNTAGGCATAQPKTVLPVVTNFIGSFDYPKYKRIAVLPFTDAPNSPHSGQIIQGLASQALAKMGFDIVERARLYDVLKEQSLSLTGIIDESQQFQIGKLLGVQAIVIGEVGQYMTVQRKTDTTYFPWTNFYTGQVTYIPIQGQQWNESYVSISLRIIDVETGQLIYSGSGQFETGLSNPPQQIAEAILFDIIDRWFAPPGFIGIIFEKEEEEFIVKEIAPNSPASKAGLKVGDKIIKVNGNDILNKSLIEMKAIFYGYPGEKVIMEISRNEKFLKFEMIRIDKREFELKKSGR